ncbi:Hsp20/alpha crystallin family protein [Streptomyces naganishii]|nr:Hsp20/alpha crystallin family protein [Streptomyces naganishii]
MEIELPGVKSKDIDVEANGPELVVTGEIKERERKPLRRSTRRVGGNRRARAAPCTRRGWQAPRARQVVRPPRPDKPRRRDRTDNPRAPRSRPDERRPTGPRPCERQLRAGGRARPPDGAPGAPHDQR